MNIHYGYCPTCDTELVNWGAASHGDGDIYDEIACPLCEEVIEERHASYCGCHECDPYGLNSDDWEDEAQSSTS